MSNWIGLLWFVLAASIAPRIALAGSIAYPTESVTLFFDKGEVAINAQHRAALMDAVLKGKARPLIGVEVFPPLLGRPDQRKTLDDDAWHARAFAIRDELKRLGLRSFADDPRSQIGLRFDEYEARKRLKRVAVRSFPSGSLTVEFSSSFAPMSLKGFATPASAWLLPRLKTPSTAESRRQSIEVMLQAHSTRFTWLARLQRAAVLEQADDWLATVLEMQSPDHVAWGIAKLRGSAFAKLALKADEPWKGPINRDFVLQLLCAPSLTAYQLSLDDYSAMLGDAKPWVSAQWPDREDDVMIEWLSCVGRATFEGRFAGALRGDSNDMLSKQPQKHLELKWLAERGLSGSTKLSSGEPIILHAIKTHRWPLMQVLLEAGNDAKLPSLVDGAGDTLLHLLTKATVQQGIVLSPGWDLLYPAQQRDLLNLALKLGADPNVKNLRGATPNISDLPCPPYPSPPKPSCF